MPAAGSVKECPVCGGTMRFREAQSVVQIPGNPSATSRTSREWICSECDYFEDVEEEN